MHLPEIQENSQETLITTTFQGYNHNEIIADGEMYDMQNLTGDEFPVISQRRKRRKKSLDVTGQPSVPLNGLHGRDQLFFIRGTECYWNFLKINGLTVSADAAMLPKKIASMGAYVCIWPDKVYLNTADLSDFGSMERKYGTLGANISLTPCTIDGASITATPSDTAPTDPLPGAYWVDTSKEKHVLKVWAATVASWEPVPTTYIKIASTTGGGIANGIKTDDAVTISDLAAPENSIDAVKKQVEALNTSMLVFARPADPDDNSYIVVAGMLSQAINACKTVTDEQGAQLNTRIDRLVPDLDYIVESNNRLWGCRYGMVNGAFVNEIKACKLGDFKNWDCYMGVSTDSYTASVGTDGKFTGAASQKGYPVFFKENCLHRVSGSSPSSFSISTTMCRGVQPGSWKSVCVVNECIYYKSVQDVMMYDGSTPSGVSSPLGNVFYSDARAGAYDGKYFINMKDGAGVRHQFVLDTKKGCWYKEDNIDLDCFGTAGVSGTDSIGSELYAICPTDNTLVSMFGSGDGTLEDDLDWFATFGLFGMDYTSQKYLSRFNIRMMMAQGATAHLWLQYDRDGEWHDEGEIHGQADRTFMIPVIPRRCDHVQFKISGHGKVTIYAISRNLEVGGDGNG